MSISNSGLIKDIIDKTKNKNSNKWDVLNYYNISLFSNNDDYLKNQLAGLEKTELKNINLLLKI